MSDFAHLFSGHASTYAAYRPTYPAALYEWLTAIAPGRAQCWDVGTGNGQVALALAWGEADAVREISWPMFVRAGTLR